MKLRRYVVAAVVLVAALGATALYADVVVGVRPFGSNPDHLYGYDPTTFAETCDIPIVIPGGPLIVGMNGVAVHPATGEIYAVAKLDGFPGQQRRLLLIDPGSGNATIVGNTGDAFAGIAFDGTGVLYGVTGDGAAVPSTLFTISLADATTTFHTTLGAGNDGETIAFNPDDGLIYHASGLGAQNVSEFFDSITIPGSPGTVTNIPLSGVDYDEAFGLVYLGGGSFALTDIASRVFTITTAGVVGGPIATLAEDTRGLALAPDNNLDGCPDDATAVPMASGRSLIVLALLLLVAVVAVLATRQWRMATGPEA